MTAFILPAARINVDLVVAPSDTTPDPAGNPVANATTISWTVPAADSGLISGFVVGVRLASGVVGTYGSLNSNVPVAATSCLISSLSPAPAQGVSLVAGVQVVGPGGFSGWAESAPFTLVAAPVAVTNVLVA